MSNRDNRITRLERKPGRKPKIVLVWRDVLRESEEQAIARRYPKGAPAAAEIVICRWQDLSD